MYTQANLLDVIAESERRKEQGMQRAVDHADAVSEEWSTRAFNASLYFILVNPVGFTFLTEDLRNWIYENNMIDPPPSDRAWGSITIKLRKAGYIISNGFSKTTNPKAHRTPATVWQIISKP